NLLKAISENALDRVNEYIAKGADVNSCIGYFTPLVYAVIRENLELVKLLITSGADVNLRYTGTPLETAIEHGNIEIVKLLLEKGADVNGVDNPSLPTEFQVTLISKTLIESALKPSSKLSIIKLLIENGANVNIKEKLYGDTPLMRAVERPDVEIVKFILDNGADVNARDNEGRTALMKAVYLKAKYGMNICKILIEYGADVNIENNDGRTALDIASSGEEIKNLLRQAGISDSSSQATDKEFDNIDEFNVEEPKLSELIPYRKGDKWCFSDRNTNTTYHASSFSEGLAVVA
ncbi:MAG TPA: hypothetical protein DCE80_01665, partial [Ignavibacteriales bacterium]|nr:hypothetical protein [Ignavibacteriales bacterium]